MFDSTKIGLLHINTTLKPSTRNDDIWKDNDSEESDDNALSPTYSSSANISPTKKGKI